MQGGPVERSSTDQVSTGPGVLRLGGVPSTAPGAVGMCVQSLSKGRREHASTNCAGQGESHAHPG